MLATSAATVVAMSFLNLLWLRNALGMGRPRDTGYFYLTPLLQDYGYFPLRYAPGTVSQMLDLERWGDLFAALVPTALANLAFAPAPVVLVVGACLLLNLGSRLTAPLFHFDRRGTFALVLLGLALPALMLPLQTVVRNVLLPEGRNWQLLVRANLMGQLVPLALAMSMLVLAAVLVSRPKRLRALGHRFAQALAVPSWGLAGLAVLGAAFAFSLSLVSQVPAAHGPNVLLISVDTLRADSLSSYGYGRETSPTLDRLARGGVLARNCIAPTSWTLPSHMTLMTGLDPSFHGVSTDSDRLASGLSTLAERFSLGGYATAGFAAAPYVNASWGFFRGFDHYDDYSVGSGNRGATVRDVMTSPQSIGLLERWLRKWSAGGEKRPFFAFLHLWDVHDSYEPPPPYDAMFDGGAAQKFQQEHPPHNGWDYPPGSEVHLQTLYDGEIRYTDENLAALVATLEELGQFENTIIAVTADHGEEFKEHGGWTHRRHLWDEVVRVPLVLHYPRKLPAGTEIEKQVRLQDVGATLLDLAGVEPGDFGARTDGGRYDAASLVPLSFGRDDSERLAFGELVHRGGNGLTMVRRDDAKLVVTTRRDGETVRFFDLVTDPGELEDRAGQGDPREDELYTALGEWLVAPRSIERQESYLMNSQIEALRSLGYID